jgi:23S rRNA pseudouridine2605 synthase
VGRLDFDTEGLLLLTDDGDFAQRIAHPRHGSTKTYEVKVKGRPPDEALDRLRAGIVLEGKRTAPCRITPHGRTLAVKRRRPRDDNDGDNTWWRVELTEGRTRQIREMFFRIGHSVQKLRRVAIGPLRDPRLPVGALRELSAEEVEKLLRSAGEPRRPAPRKKAPAKKKGAVPGKTPEKTPEKAAKERRPRERRTLAEVSREAGRKPKTPKPRKIARKAAPAGRPSGRSSGPRRGRG